VLRVLAIHFRPQPGADGPSWRLVCRSVPR
jgi:hypothetical protein